MGGARKEEKGSPITTTKGALACFLPSGAETRHAPSSVHALSHPSSLASSTSHITNFKFLFPFSSYQLESGWIRSSSLASPIRTHRGTTSPPASTPVPTGPTPSLGQLEHLSCFISFLIYFNNTSQGLRQGDSHWHFLLSACYLLCNWYTGASSLTSLSPVNGVRVKGILRGRGGCAGLCLITLQGNWNSQLYKKSQVVGGIMCFLYFLTQVSSQNN